MARKKKPLFGVNTYIKKKPRKRPRRHSKKPTKAQNVNAIVGRAENVFFNVILFGTLTYILQ